MYSHLRTGLAFLATGLVSPAFAHTGDHTHMTIAELVDHASSAHMVLLAGVLALVAGAVWLKRRAATREAQARHGKGRRP